MLVRNGYTIPNESYFDTYVAAKWCHPDLTDYGLEALALHMTDMPQWRQTIGKLAMDDFEQMSNDVLANRCAGDAEAPLKLKKVLEPEIKRLKLTKIWNLGMSCLPVLAEIGGLGMYVNIDELKKRASSQEGGVGYWLEKEKADLESLLKIDNLHSHQQLAKILYKDLKAVPLRETTKGWSTDRLSLYWARFKAQEENNQEIILILNRLLEYGTQSKLHSTYYTSWLSGIGADGRVHSNYSLGGTISGRLSSFDFNLQNTPDSVRELVVPSPGYDIIVAADESAIELRTAAHVSRDPTLVEWIRNKVDIHSRIAARVLGLSEPRTQEEFARFKKEHNKERQAGKKAVFSSLYGVSAESLAWQLFKESDGLTWIPPMQMQQYLDMIFKTFYGYKQYITELWYKLLDNNWIVSETGRRWVFEATRAGWRQAQNFPIQSLASDLMLIGLRKLFYELKRLRMKSRLIGTVHDSVILEAPKAELKTLYKLLKECLENPDTSKFGFSLRVPLAVETKIGPTFKQLEVVA